MRSSEIFVKDCIVDYLASEFENIISSEGDEPPDYYLFCDGEKIPLEITQCLPLIKDGSKLVESETYNRAVLEFADKINDQYKELLPDYHCLLLTIYIPIENFKKFKSHLVSFIDKYLANHGNYGMNGDVMIANEKIDVNMVTGCDSKYIITAVTPKNESHEFMVNKHVKNMLEKAITEKSAKMIKFRDRENTHVWLGLFNNNILAHERNYLDAFKEIDIEHCFSRIYVVMADKNVLSFNFNNTSAVE